MRAIIGWQAKRSVAPTKIVAANESWIVVSAERFRMTLSLGRRRSPPRVGPTFV
jgi:hypothetical protein